MQSWTFNQVVVGSIPTRPTKQPVENKQYFHLYVDSTYRTLWRWEAIGKHPESNLCHRRRMTRASVAFDSAAT